MRNEVALNVHFYAVWLSNHFKKNKAIFRKGGKSKLSYWLQTEITDPKYT